jgi:hypothetical protein
MARKIQPSSRPHVATDPRSRFAATKDGYEVRLRIALRLGNGCVLTARQCEQLATALGWIESQETIA